MSRSVNSPKAVAAAALLSGSGAAYFMVSPYLVGTAIDTLQLSERQAGLIPSTYFFGYLLVCLTAVFWMRRFHWQFVSLFGYALLISGLFGAAATDNFELLLATTFIAGMGGGTLFGLPMCIISDSDNPDRGFGLKIVAEQAIGVVLLLGLPVYVTHTWGFKGINVVLGLVLILLAMATFWVPAHGVRADDAGGHSANAGNGVYVGIGLLALMLFFGGLSGLYAFVERLATERGFDPVSIGQSLALGTIGGGVGGFAVAVIGDRYGRSKPVFLSALVLLCVFAFYTTQFSKLTFAVATVFFLGAWNFSLAYQLGIVANLDISGRFAVLMSSALALGAMLGPALAGALLAGSDYTPIFLLAGSSVVVSLAIFIGLSRSFLAFDDEKSTSNNAND